MDITLAMVEEMRENIKLAIAMSDHMMVEKYKQWLQKYLEDLALLKKAIDQDASEPS